MAIAKVVTPRGTIVTSEMALAQVNKYDQHDALEPLCGEIIALIGHCIEAKRKSAIPSIISHMPPNTSGIPQVSLGLFSRVATCQSDELVPPVAASNRRSPESTIFRFEKRKLYHRGNGDMETSVCSMRLRQGIGQGGPVRVAHDEGLDSVR